MAYSYNPRCPACPNTHYCTGGDGDRPTKVMCIGERPGRGDRDRLYVDRSGEEFNRNYLRLAGLDRESIYFTNTVKCSHDDPTRKPTATEKTECSQFFLPDEIDRCQPEIIVLMGATACSLIPGCDVDVEHGIPRFDQELFGWTGTVVPMYHPSSGMHDTGMMIPMLEDWERLSSVVDGTYRPPSPLPVGAYLHVETLDDCPGHPLVGPNSLIAIDTETQNDKPFSVQICWQPATALFIPTPVNIIHATVQTRVLGGIPLLPWFESRINSINPAIGGVVLHNAPGDLDTLEQVGIKVRPELIRDTMQEAYHLGNLPQGLKALAYRLLGVRMKSYLDVVMPPSRDKALDWIVNAIETVTDNYKIRTTEQLKTKLKVILKPTPQEQGLRRILKHGCFSDEYDVWTKVKELRGRESANDPVWSRVDSTWGPVPLPGIANVPIEEAVQYGCMDADITYRVARKLEEMRAEREGLIGVCEEDKDSRMGKVARRVLR